MITPLLNVLMNKRFIVALATLLLAIILAAVLFQQLAVAPADDSDQIYIGVAFGGDTVEEAKALIDRTKTYTNLFILQSGPISYNETATTEICDYATQNGQSFIVYFGDMSPRVLDRKDQEWRLTWVENAKTTYGNQFLGVYYYDEPAESTLTQIKAHSAG